MIYAASDQFVVQRALPGGSHRSRSRATATRRGDWAGRDPGRDRDPRRTRPIRGLAAKAITSRFDPPASRFTPRRPPARSTACRRCDSCCRRNGSTRRFGRRDAKAAAGRRFRAMTIHDRPRFAWRGAMLDVARHFLQVDEVKRYIDLMALHKLNRLHLHLADDQGWRIEIKSWPNLAAHGGTHRGRRRARAASTRRSSTPTSCATQRSASSRSCRRSTCPGTPTPRSRRTPELNCDGVAPPLYTGIEVGFSALCVDKEVTYKFIDDVVREIAALTPGPVLPHRRRRGEDADAGAVQRVHRARAGDRADARQADDRLGRDRADEAAADVDRPALAAEDDARPRRWRRARR